MKENVALQIHQSNNTQNNTLNNTQNEAKKTKLPECTSNTEFIIKVHRVYAIWFEYLCLTYKQHTKRGYSM